MNSLPQNANGLQLYHRHKPPILCYNRSGQYETDKQEAPVETFVYVVKYTFIAALAVEAVLIARAIIGVALEKARAAKSAPAAE